MLNNIRESLKLLERKDRFKLFVIMAIQIVMGFLDLFGVIIIGGLAALSIQGIESQNAGNKVSALLRFFYLSNFSFQSQVAILGILGGLVFIFKTIVSVLFTRKTFYFLAIKSAQFSSDLISKILSQNLIGIQKNNSQELLYIVSSGVNNIMTGILATSITVISDTALMLILLVGLIMVDPVIAIATLFLFLLIGFFLHHFLQVRAQNLGSGITKFTVKNNEKIIEVLNSYRETVVRHRQKFYAEQIRKLRTQLAALTAESNFQPYIGKYVVESAAMLGSLALAGYEFGTKNATHAVATLGLFLAASTRIAPAALRLQQGALSIKNSIGGARGTFDLIDDLKEIEPVTSDGVISDFEYVDFIPDFKMVGVTFKYPSSTKFSLGPIDLSILPGSTTAIVGPSGAGKTTLVDLMLGVLAPTNGEVLISGMRPSEVSQHWPGAMSYVPQNIVIVSGTVSENVTLGYDETSINKNAVYEAISAAQLSQDIANLENGIGTMVGENGAMLSGGQRQRLGIARAMFTKPKLLVFDEATSSLDGETEADVTEAISKLSGQVTVVIIAHRLSTIRGADQVVYLENGSVRAIGTFEQVKAQVPQFAKEVLRAGL